MAYNPNIHHRRSIRLKGYDYSQAGAYFITICCEDRGNRKGLPVQQMPFGKIEKDEMILNEFGNIAYNEWAKLAERFANFELDVFQIMPNHMHGIILLNNVGARFTPAQNGQPQGIVPTDAQNDISNVDVGAGFTPAQNANDTIHVNKKGQPQGLPLQISGDDNRAWVNRAPTIGDIVGAYKSLVFNGCLEIFKSKNETMGKLWQRNYHEHIIRNEKSYQTISEYIINNPVKWADDKFYKI